MKFTALNTAHGDEKKRNEKIWFKLEEKINKYLRKVQNKLNVFLSFKQDGDHEEEAAIVPRRH